MKKCFILSCIILEGSFLHAQSRCIEAHISEQTKQDARQLMEWVSFCPSSAQYMMNDGDKELFRILLASGRPMYPVWFESNSLVAWEGFQIDLGIRSKIMNKDCSVKVPSQFTEIAYCLSFIDD